MVNSDLLFHCATDCCYFLTLPHVQVNKIKMFQPQLKLIIHLKLLSSLCKQPVIRFFFFICYFEQSEFEPWLGTLYCDTLHCTFVL